MAITLIELKNAVLGKNSLNTDSQTADVTDKLLAAVNDTLNEIYRAKIVYLKKPATLTKTAPETPIGGDTPLYNYEVVLPDGYYDFDKSNVRDAFNPQLIYIYVDDQTFNPLIGYAQYIVYGNKMIFSNNSFSQKISITYYDKLAVSYNDNGTTRTSSSVLSGDWFFKVNGSDQYQAVINLPADLFLLGANAYFQQYYNTNLPTEIRNKAIKNFSDALAQHGSTAGVIVVSKRNETTGFPVPSGAIPIVYPA